MNTSSSRPSFAQLFTPKIVTVFKEGYGTTELKHDVVAGLTVAIVALPLSMAIAIASGVSPDKGLWTSIVGGFLVSLLGGSRFQIGGPAGAFIVLVAATVQRNGLDGLFLTTFLAGIFLTIGGFLRLGTYIKFIPFPVTVGFTTGIAIIIFFSQVSSAFGLQITGTEPGAILDKIPVLVAAANTISIPAISITVLTLATILAVRKFLPGWPDMLIALTLASVLAFAMGLQVETIGTKFGGIPASVPVPHIPLFSLAKVRAVLPDAIAFALLGMIESLLSAVVADGMTGRRHRSNSELVGQGIANIASSIFGAMAVTGNIARTATNIRAGAHGPLAGIFHSLFLIVFVVVAAPLASYIPITALAGILIFVAWNMAEKSAIRALLRKPSGDAVVLIVTLLLTVFRDLTEAITVGFAIGSVLFIHRMSQTTAIESVGSLVAEDVADDDTRPPYHEEGAIPDVVVHRIRGALFFGATSILDAVLDQIRDHHRVLVLDFTEVPFVDASGANSIHSVTEKAVQRGIAVFIVGTDASETQILRSHGIDTPGVGYCDTVREALDLWKVANIMEDPANPNAPTG